MPRVLLPGRITYVAAGDFTAQTLISDGKEFEKGQPAFYVERYTPEEAHNDPKQGDWYPMTDLNLNNLILTDLKEHAKRVNGHLAPVAEGETRHPLVVYTDVLDTNKGQLVIGMRTDQHNTPRIAKVLLDDELMKLDGMKDLADFIANTRIKGPARAPEASRESSSSSSAASKRPTEVSAEGGSKRPRKSSSGHADEAVVPERFKCRADGCPGYKSSPNGACDSQQCPRKRVVPETSSTSISLDDAASEQDDVEALEEAIKQAKSTYEQAQRTLETMCASLRQPPDMAGYKAIEYVDMAVQWCKEQADQAYNLEAAKEQYNQALLHFEERKKKLDDVRDVRRLLAAAQDAYDTKKAAAEDALKNFAWDPDALTNAAEEWKAAKIELDRLTEKESEVRASNRADQAVSQEEA